MRKVVLLMLLTIVIVFSISGCGFSKYEVQGEKNAIQYIEDKYGFKPTVKSVKSQSTNNSPIPFSSSSDTGYVYVKMKHDDKEFYVFISGTSENTDGIDNYQVDAIENAISNKIQEMLPNVINIDFCIGNEKVASDDPYYGFIPLKYDGDNLNEVLEKAQLKRIVVSLADSDLSSLTEELIKDTFGAGIDILFVNYKSVEDYQKAENTTYGLWDYGISTGIEKNDAYIVDYKEF